MADYYIAIDHDGQPYIEHHGVMGMKWGVRRARYNNQRDQKNRARRKTTRLVKSAAKKREKADRLTSKARKSRYGITDTGRTIWENRQLKAGKANRKASRAEAKARRWIDRMDKELSGIPLSELYGR